jgi:hypothetical protein
MLNSTLTEFVTVYFNIAYGLVKIYSQCLRTIYIKREKQEVNGAAVLEAFRLLCQYSIS